MFEVCKIRFYFKSLKVLQTLIFFLKMRLSTLLFAGERSDKNDVIDIPSPSPPPDDLDGGDFIYEPTQEQIALKILFNRSIDRWVKKWLYKILIIHISV